MRVMSIMIRSTALDTQVNTIQIVGSHCKLGCYTKFKKKPTRLAIFYLLGFMWVFEGSFTKCRQ